MITSMFDVVGKYAVDSEGNMLPMRKETVAMYCAHTGNEIWVKSTLPGADSSDVQRFGHVYSNTLWFNREYNNRMVRIVSVMKYDYNVGMWYWYNEVHSA